MAVFTFLTILSITLFQYSAGFAEITHSILRKPIIFSNPQHYYVLKRHSFSRESSTSMKRYVGFLSDMFGKGKDKNEKLTQNSRKDEKNDTIPKDLYPEEKEEEDVLEENMIAWDEDDFRKELQKRRDNGEVDESEKSKVKEFEMNEEEQTEFDGYALRDTIYNKWGKCFDIDFQPVQSFGFKELYLNVLPFHLGGRRFRHDSEYDYLCHLQAIVEILIKYDQLDYILAQIQETSKKPRPGTSPLVAVPLRLDLTNEQLDDILA